MAYLQTGEEDALICILFCSCISHNAALACAYPHSLAWRLFSPTLREHPSSSHYPLRQVHDTQLQLAVRTCYSIHLTSQNAVNQSVAKTGLNQMLTSVFDRMEKYFLTKPEGESSSLGELSLVEGPAD